MQHCARRSVAVAFLVLVLVFVVAVPPVSAQADGPADIDPTSARFSVAAAIAAQGLLQDQVGFHVVDTASGAVLASRNADRAFVPASVAKIPTTIAALERLGPRHRFRTDVLATGPLVGGRVEGDLYLRGGGDPFLTSDDLAALVDRLRATGVVGVAGRLFYDSSLYPSATEIDPHQPDTAAYNTGISAFALNFNIINVRWARQGGALVAQATTNTETRRLPASTVRFATVPPGSPWAGFFTPADDSDGEAWLLAPALPTEGQDWLPVRRPARLAAAAFAQLARENGITLPGPEPGVTPAQAQVLASHDSRPLVDIVRGVLRYSNNLSAEMLGLATTRSLAPAPVTLTVSGRLLGDWLSSRFPQIDWTGVVLANHSGLSTASRLSPRQVAELLALTHARVYDDEDYAALLRTPPWLAEVNAQRRTDGLAPIALAAKSGTMNYARGLAGVLEPGDGRRLAFAVFINDLAARAALADRASAVTAGTRAWLARARLLERDLLIHWATWL